MWLMTKGSSCEWRVRLTRRRNHLERNGCFRFGGAAVMRAIPRIVSLKSDEDFQSVDTLKWFEIAAHATLIEEVA